MTALSFVPLGVGDAFSASYYSSCLAVHADGVWVLIDCPHPIRKMMREAAASASVSLDVENVHAVLLTHLHADHASGIEGLAYYTFFRLRRRARVAAHPDVADQLWSGHLAGSMGQPRLMPGRPVERKSLDDYIELSHLSDESAVQIGPFSIECRKTIHPIPTTAFRIRANGRTLGYSSDTSYDPSLIWWLAEADLVVHETNVGIHTPYEQLAELPEQLRRKMRLIHFPDDFDAGASAIEVLEQGRRYEV